MSAESIDAKLARIGARVASRAGQRLDLTDRASWQASREHDRTLARNVIMSLCGRYTIVRFSRIDTGAEAFQAFRRHGPPEQSDRHPPSWTQTFDTADAARAGCQQHQLAEMRA